MKNYWKILFGLISLSHFINLYAQDKNVQELYKSIQILDKNGVEKYAKKIGNLSSTQLNGEPPLNYLFYTFREYFPDNGIGIVEILVKHGANPNSIFYGAYNTQSYALESACQAGNAKAVKKLIELGANVKNGYPLHIAATWRRLDVVKLLVEEYHLDVNAKDYNNETPLIKSVLYYDKNEVSLPIVKYLIEKGASKDVTNSKGETALDLAIKNNNYPVINYLKSLGVQQNVETTTKKEKRCPKCEGTGLESESAKIYKDCNWCGGKGYKEKADQVVGANQTVKFYQKYQCTNCQGKGKIFSHTELVKCTRCYGKGFIKE